MSPDHRPNVLVIMTDQQSATAMSCAGNADVATPAIDSLAESGVRFRRAYCTSPLCTPSRASMMTGRLPSEVGVSDNIQGVPSSFPEHTMGRIFSAAGYDCAYAGKWHVPGVAHDRDSGFRGIFDGAHEGLADECARYLAHQRDQPFLLVASLNEPHGICEWARGQAPPSGEVAEPDWRDLPLLPPNFAAGAEEPEALRLVQEFAWTVHPTAGWDEEKWRRYRYAYYRLCERADAQIVKLLDGLDHSGLRDNTMIVFTSDHGDMQGAHGWNQKKNLYDEAARVPFILVPPHGAAVSVRDQLVSVGLDLLPTLCDYAAITPDPDWSGRSVRGLVERDPLEADTREQVVAETEWTFPGLMPPPAMAHLLGRMVRTARYKYQCFSWGRHREQLFDMQADPGEMTNLATSGRHQDVLDEHRRRLAAHCDDVGDGFARYVPRPGVAPR